MDRIGKRVSGIGYRCAAEIQCVAGIVEHDFHHVGIGKFGGAFDRVARGGDGRVRPGAGEKPAAALRCSKARAKP